jgi:cytidyltransferase-like protein
MNGARKRAVVTGGFDDLRSRDLRFLEEASRFGDLIVLLWPDEAIQRLTGKPPEFPQEERLYFLRAVCYVNRVELVSGQIEENTLPDLAGFRPEIWVVDPSRNNPAKQTFAASAGLEFRVADDKQLRTFPPAPAPQPAASAGRKKVLVTGCYDWFHSGHVRFFEEVSAYGDLYVCVGHDANIRLLKGEGRPLFPQDERRYMAGSIRFVTQALITSGDGWLDAEPEIQAIRPDIYAVNEDGDVPEKREYCRKRGIEYLVLKRAPAPGLPARSSTDLRGF